MLQTFLPGAVPLATIVVAIFFWRFQKTGRDRFFGFFAVAFLLFGLERIGAEFITANPRSLLYLVCLAAFLLILFEILDKNRKERKS